MISIIVPIYNADAYLSECFESLLKQTYTKFEVICVNDGSTDRSGSICKHFSDKDSRFVYIEQINGGVSKARNKGIEIANGEFICFLDADDTLPNYALDVYMKSAIGHDTVVGYTTRGNTKKYVDSKVTYHEGIDYILNDYLINNTNYQFCNYLYRKNILDKVGLKFSEDLKYGEDEEFTWKYLSHCKTAITIDVTLYNYRDNPTSASHTVSYSRVQVIDSMIRVYDYYKSLNHNFSEKLYKWGIPRAKLSILKQFAVNKRKDLFRQLTESKKYDRSMLPLLRFPNFNIKLASLIYSLSPYLFFTLLSKK